MRRARLLISRIMLVELFKSKSLDELSRCTKGLPDDAKFVKGGIHDNFDKDCISLVFESEEFEDIPEGAEYPFIKVEYQRIYSGDYDIIFKKREKQNEK